MLNVRVSHEDQVEKKSPILHAEYVMLNVKNEKCHVQSLRLNTEYAKLNVQLFLM